MVISANMEFFPGALRIDQNLLPMANAFLKDIEVIELLPVSVERLNVYRPTQQRLALLRANVIAAQAELKLWMFSFARYEHVARALRFQAIPANAGQLAYAERLVAAEQLANGGQPASAGQLTDSMFVRRPVSLAASRYDRPRVLLSKACFCRAPCMPELCDDVDRMGKLSSNYSTIQMA
jgi:hypothetical protein